jgi:hypothetical protein
MSYKIIRLLGINSNNVAIDSFCSGLCVCVREREGEGRTKKTPTGDKFKSGQDPQTVSTKYPSTQSSPSGRRPTQKSPLIY